MNADSLRSRLDRLHDSAGTSLLNIAHRGARGSAPENTLEAFEKASSMGAHMFELDVHLTADGQVIVHHDDDVRRCTDAAQRLPDRSRYFVSDFSLAELQTLDAGSWFARDRATHAWLTAGELARYAAGGVRVPTLEQVLELAANTGRLVNVELKSLPRLYPELASRTLACIEYFGMRDKVLISSFDHQQLVMVRAQQRQVATGLLCGGRLAQSAAYLQLLDADAYHPSCSAECDSVGFHSVAGGVDAATTAEFRALRAADKHINVWTCNDPAQMRQLVAAGVTGIITDHPERLASL